MTCDKILHWKLILPDTDSARKLAAFSNGRQHSKNTMAFSAQNSVQPTNFYPESCSRLGCVPLE